MKNQVEIEAVTSFFKLAIFHNESIYENVPNIRNNQNNPSGNIVATMTADANPIYKNMLEQTYIEEAKIGEKTF